MEVINVKQVYRVDTISKSNDKAWNKLIEIISEYPKDTEVMLDFLGINIIEPWGNETFRKLLGYQNVHFKVYNSARIAATINAACKLGNLKTGRVVNQDDEDEAPVASKEETYLSKLSEEYEKLIYIEGDTAKFDVYKKLTQIGSATTARAVGQSVITFCKKNGLKKAIINTDSIFIQKNVFEPLAKIISDGIRVGVKINIKSSTKEVNEKVEMYNCLADKEMLSGDEKAKVIMSSIEPYTVGMISKYRDSRAKDEFGRYGNGEVLNCRVALFKGITGSGMSTLVHFRAYVGTTFFTRSHWALEHDGEELSKLEYADYAIPIDELGFMNNYIGSKFHFILPIQQDTEKYTVYALDSENKLKHMSVTIPARIKMVLDDWEIEYNQESLDMCIEETDKFIEQETKK